MSIEIKRVYDIRDMDQGYRILVDRLLPRGVKKSDLKLDERCKEISPTDKLRKWFGYDLKKWDEFKKRYKSELLDHSYELQRIKNLGERSPIILLYSARDKFHNQAVVLKDLLET